MKTSSATPCRSGTSADAPAAINEASLEAWSLERDAYFSTQCEQGDTCDCPEYEAACGSNGCELR
jgi:hypothetical protein